MKRYGGPERMTPSYAMKYDDSRKICRAQCSVSSWMLKLPAPVITFEFANSTASTAKNVITLLGIRIFVFVYLYICISVCVVYICMCVCVSVATSLLK